MKSGSTSQLGGSSIPQRLVLRPIVLIAGAVVLVAAAVALYRAVHEDAAPGPELGSQRAASPTDLSATAASPTERKPVLPPTLPEAPSAQSSPDEPGPAESRAAGFATQAARRKLTQAKVEKYVREAYPAWLRAHPGEMCPHQLIELNEYTGDSDAKDAWGHPIKMLCGDHWGGKKHIEVIALGRDAQLGTDDDIRAEQ
jgi:cell division protein FtsN